MKILEIFIKQLLFIYIGGGILYIYYKLRNKNISFSDIINKDGDNGMKKYRYTAFYIGLIFLAFIVIFLKLTIMK